MSKRRSIRNKMKSLKINYLQGCKLLRFMLLQTVQKRAKPQGFAPTEKVLLKLLCYSTINFCV